MKSWQLPEHVADVLPTNARQLESARERLLALFRVHGYELVQPPLMEYSHSLLTHIDAGLSLKTILVVDQLSGRQLGVARILRRRWRVLMPTCFPPTKASTVYAMPVRCFMRGLMDCSICASLYRQVRKCTAWKALKRISN